VSGPVQQVAALAERYTGGLAVTNPIDVANPGVPPVILREVLLNAAVEEKIDLQILIQLLYVYKSFQRLENKSLKEATPYIELGSMIEEVEKLTGKPVVLVLPNNMQGQEDLDVEEVRRMARNLFLKKNILSFENLTDALKSIGQVSRYYARRDGLAGVGNIFCKVRSL
jgi:hypothetical protein